MPDSGRDDRGVSEVIAVVVLVAVTIVLAALAGTVILDIVAGTDRDPVAGAGIEFDDANDSVRVTYQAVQSDGTTLTVRVYNSSTAQVASEPLDDVGDAVAISLTDGERYRVLIVADTGEKTAVVNDVDGQV
jgi:flagellin-like protein